MKKLIYGVLFIGLIGLSMVGCTKENISKPQISSSFENLNNQKGHNDVFYSKTNKPWWKTAIVDAAGALGGASGVLSFTHGTASLTPWGWGAVGLGAVVGGAGASIGYAGLQQPNDGNNGSNSNNPMDYIGLNHNKILIDFKNSNIEYTPKNLLDFVIKNKDKYGINNDISFPSLKTLDSLNLVIENIMVNGKEEEWMLSMLPNDYQDKEGILNLINSIQVMDNKNDVIDKIKNYENNQVESSSNNRKQSDLLILSFLSTLRNSTLLWY